MRQEKTPNPWQALLARHGLQYRPVYAIGFNVHWRSTLARFTSGSQLTHVRSAERVPAGALALVWGQQPVALQQEDIVLMRLEDGFLRSVGLGAEFAAALSWVVDFDHLYFDASGASRLESLLSQHRFSDADLARAGRLIDAITSARLSKYNNHSGTWQRPDRDKVILVPGQVEGDASITFGAPGINTNMALLQAVRQHNPQAWVVYKPHPDVVAGARQGGVFEQVADQWCDEIVQQANIAAMLEQVDEVHTLTSLTGFEALLRGRRVTCYGLPFYAGWGLTQDLHNCHRRSRTLSLEELAHAVLIQYPFYNSLYGEGFIEPEQALQELQRQRKVRVLSGMRIGQYARKAINLIRGARHA